MVTYPRYESSGDASLIVYFGSRVDLVVLQQVISASDKIKAHNIKGVIEIIPAYASITICFDLCLTDYHQLKEKLKALCLLPELAPLPEYPTVNIPACYDASLGLDIHSVAEHSGLSVNDVIRLHSEPLYHVYMLGFMPGFLYLGGLDSRIAMPRKAKPRTHIEQGAIGIAGQQTGIYPFTSPGGWQIIACTPTLMFDSSKPFPAIAKPLQTVRFIPISLDEYQSLKGDQAL